MYMKAFVKCSQMLVLLLGENKEKEEEEGGKNTPLFAQYCARCWGGQDGKIENRAVALQHLQSCQVGGRKTAPVE